MDETNKFVSGDIKKIDIEETNKQAMKRFWQKKWFLSLAGAFLLLFLALAIPGFVVMGKVKTVQSELLQLKEAAKTKDLKIVAEKTAATKKSLNELEKSLKMLSWVGWVPWVGHFEQDAVHLTRAGQYGLEAGEIVIAAVSPYADIIGFTGGEKLGGGEKTAEDRINFLVTTLDKISPQLDSLSEKVVLAQKEIDKVDPNRYPQSFRGQKIREPLQEVVTLVDEMASLSTDAKPLLANAPWFLGTDAPRRYLLLFQNDGELRPTGGFITAYAIIEVDKGKIKPGLSEDIYALDASYKPTKEAPTALVKYVSFPYSKDSRWRLRDMNISPDFAVSMETFSPEFVGVSKLKFDGIVAVDTQVLVRLLKVLGPVGVSGWGNFSAEPDSRCDGCPQVVYQLELLITKPLNRIVAERKAVIGPLMHSLLANAMGSPKEKLPGLFEAIFSSTQEKHVLFYFPEEKIQNAVESFNLAGRIKEFEGDYFHLNDANFSGAKVNIFIKQEVEQKIEVARDGTVTKTVTVTYKNPSPPSDCNLESGGLCLNAPYRDWVRLYVPQGSKLVDSSGFESEIEIYEELGKTVFEGFFGDKYPLRPQGQAKVSFKYQLPFKVDKGDYRLLIQKQPGADEPDYLIELNGQKQEFQLKTDKELKFKI